jgi:hypothetical protein
MLFAAMLCFAAPSRPGAATAISSYKQSELSPVVALVKKTLAGS